MNGDDIKITPYIPAAEPALDAITMTPGYPPAEQWHEHPEARQLIARARLKDLPGLSEAIRGVLIRAEGRRNPKTTKGTRLGSWPDSVLDYCTYVWGDKTGVDALAEWEGIGEGTISAINEILKKYGIGPGMRFSDFDDWMRSLKPYPNIRV